jgi:signal transduction histidine kinase
MLDSDPPARFRDRAAAELEVAAGVDRVVAQALFPEDRRGLRDRPALDEAGRVERCGGERHDFALRIADCSDCANLDPARIEQALGNLVSNSLAYGAGAVRLTARKNHAGVELHVTDEGPGFPPAFLERAFDRFSRGDEARGRGGAGLGLSIVKLIAEAHGGTAKAANRPSGADVWITLP